MSLARRSRRRLYDPDYYDNRNTYGELLPGRAAAASGDDEMTKPVGARHVHSGTPERSDVVGGPDFRNDASQTDPNIENDPLVHGQDKALVEPEKSPFADLTVKEFNKRNRVKPQAEVEKDEAKAKDVEAKKDDKPAIATDDLNHGFGKSDTFPDVRKR